MPRDEHGLDVDSLRGSEYHVVPNDDEKVLFPASSYYEQLAHDKNTRTTPASVAVVVPASDRRPVYPNVPAEGLGRLPDRLTGQPESVADNPTNTRADSVPDDERIHGLPDGYRLVRDATSGRLYAVQEDQTTVAPTETRPDTAPLPPDEPRVDEPVPPAVPAPTPRETELNSQGEPYQRASNVVP